MPHNGSPTSSATASAPPTRELFGLPFLAASLPEVRGYLLRELAAGRRHVVITPNTDHLVRLRREPGLGDVYRAADIVLADGMPVVWASALLGRPIPERVAGVDLMATVSKALRGTNQSVFLLGGTQASVARAAEGLARSHPGLVVAGCHHGYFDVSDGVDVVRRINESGATVLYVGMGSPRQERWVAARLADLSPALILCIGGALDVLAGTRSRAPRWMQRSGLEWSYRLVQEPRRLWRRYLVEDAAFVPMVLSEWRTLRRARANR